jgi:nucleoside-diphosphate-sugar epimerase
VLVTGGAGFIGAALLARLRELGVDAVGVDVVADPASGVHGATTDPASWAHLLDGAGAVITPPRSCRRGEPRRAWRSTLGTRRVIEVRRPRGAAAGAPKSSWRSASPTPTAWMRRGRCG